MKYVVMSVAYSTDPIAVADTAEQAAAHVQTLHSIWIAEHGTMPPPNYYYIPTPTVSA